MNFGYLFPILLILGGILILKIPRRFNPFQLRPVLAQFFSEETQYRIPKIVGWFIFISGCVWLLLSLALMLMTQSATEKRHDSTDDFIANGIAEEKQKADILRESILESDSYTILCRDGSRFVTAVKSSKIALEDLKSALVIVPREKLNSSTFLTPNIVLQFNLGDKTIAQLKMAISVDLTAYVSFDPRSKTTHEGRFDESATGQLLTALKRHDQETLTNSLSRIEKPPQKNK